ncbi:MAG: sigma-70 family RNA polymerase sigma factor [Victivallaceae bacterium]|nr:sigma-70 family RNA polymerase sigma factor [Victivallaceae bacterium]
MPYTTNKSLLARVRAGDEISWKDFYTTYAPLIREVGRFCGVHGHDNETLVVQVMTDIFQKDILARYDPDHVPDDVSFQHDPAKGRFRFFLRGIARNHARNLYRKYRKFDAFDENDASPCLHDEEWENVWDREWRRHVLAMAMVELRHRVRPKTYVAFEMYAVKEIAIEKVAAFLKCSVDSVYTAKTRCIKALKEIVNSLEEA